MIKLIDLLKWISVFISLGVTGYCLYLTVDLVRDLLKFCKKWVDSDDMTGMAVTIVIFVMGVLIACGVTIKMAFELIN